jgi:DNA-binding NarL/FixJ family response regulator
MSPRVLGVDDDAMVRSGFIAILRSDGMDVIGEAADGAEAVAMARALHPDVVTMDVRMPVLDGITATTRLLDLPEPPRVLVVTTFENDSFVLEALEAGAHGFLLKRSGADQLIHAVRTVAASDGLLYPQSIRALVAVRPDAREPSLDRLTEREAEVLRLVATGLSNGEIAKVLFLGIETVKSHVRSVLDKLGARDRTQAAIIAWRSGFARG